MGAYAIATLVMFCFTGREVVQDQKQNKIQIAWNKGKKILDKKNHYKDNLKE